MTFTYRFAVLSCISMEDKATEDHDSLDHQLRTAIAYGERWGGTFTREYRADGFSRSGWFDLSQVFTAEPESFGELAQDARKHKFDVLIVESFDRLGDIGMALFNYFQSLGEPYIQIVSAQQRIMIDDPKVYHPRRDDSIPNALAEALKVNKYRTNKNFRAFEMGNTARARDGKYANTFPYGYLKKETGHYNKNGKPIHDLILDETVADLLRQFPKWFLSGATYIDIARRADESGVPPPEAEVWDDGYVKYILRNPFYCGKTFYRRTEKIGKGYYRERDDAELYDGNHPAIWSYDTYLQIRAEMQRRMRVRNKPKKTDYNFTKLLRCSECGSHLSICYSGQRQNNKYWRCLNCGKVNIAIRLANQAVADELTRLFKDRDYQPTPEERVKDNTKREISKLESQIRRDTEAYDAGAYTPQVYAELRTKKLARLEELKNEEFETEAKRRQVSDRDALLTSMRELAPGFHYWITSHDPRSVNFDLSRIVILTAYPDKTIKVEQV